MPGISYTVSLGLKISPKALSVMLLIFLVRPEETNILLSKTYGAPGTVISVFNKQDFPTPGGPTAMILNGC